MKRIAVLIVWALLVVGQIAAAQVPGRGGPPPRVTPDDERITVTPGQRGGDLRDVARSGIWLEYALIGSPGDVAVADAALTGAGAQLLRVRPLPGLARELRIYALRRLSLEQGRSIVAQVAGPAPRLDLNTLYRFAQGTAGPRLYASDLLGAAPGCRLPRSVLVGMIDGPVAAGHPALAGAQLTVLSALLPGDRAVSAGHGTAVAALIAGEAPGLSGFAPGVTLVSVTAFAQEGGDPGADVDRIAGALDALARSGADVVNMSFTGPPNTVLADLLQAMAARGTLMVAAVGNSGGEEALFPAAAPDVIAVTAVDAGLRLYRRATRGAHIDVAAPGVDLYVAASDGGGRYVSGTSYAAPIVTAMAARLYSGGLRSTARLQARIQSLSRDLGAPGRDAQTGWGLISAPRC